MKEIGSSFYIKDYQESNCSETYIPLQLQGKHTEYYSSCRDALRVVLDTEKITAGCAMVPPFTCHAVLQPFLERGLTVKPYSISFDLSIDVETTLKLISDNNPAIFIYHSYFGFFDQGIDQLYNVLNEHGTLIIEDRTQNMFSYEEKTRADYVVGSVRKWLEIPDGGFLNTDNPLPLRSYKKFESLISISMDALKRKYRFLAFDEGTDKEYREEFAKCERILGENQDIYSISKETNNICYRFDWSKLKTSRIDNYTVLMHGLAGIRPICVIDQFLNPGVVPFMFPIYVRQNRKELQAFLASKKIFATIIWGCPEVLVNQISDVEKTIYNQILCFPIDQRYKKRDMERIISCMKDYYREK